MARPRVLFLACHLPFPPLSGGRRRELELIKRLSESFDIHLAVVSKTFAADLENAHELERFCGAVEVFAAEPWAGGDEPPHVLRHRCPPLGERIAELLAGGDIDLVHVEGFYLMQHVPETALPVMLVEQNIEYDLERQRAASRVLRNMRTRRAELDAWRRADLLGVLTHEDRELMLSAMPGADVRLIPDGADHLPTAAGTTLQEERPHAPLLVFLANFAYPPNVDAAGYLCESILPRVRERVPDVHLWLVGTDPPAEVEGRAESGVRVTGRVPDVIPFIDAADVMVCPLRVGGGIKVKSIEALRRGKCAVSTSVGAQGLPPDARAGLVVADDSESFAEAVAQLLRDADRRAQLERRSAAAARNLPTWDDAVRALEAAYGDLLERHEPSRKLA